MPKQVTALLESIDLANLKILASVTKRLGNCEFFPNYSDAYMHTIV